MFEEDTLNNSSLISLFDLNRFFSQQRSISWTDPDDEIGDEEAEYIDNTLTKNKIKIIFR